MNTLANPHLRIGFDRQHQRLFYGNWTSPSEWIFPGRLRDRYPDPYIRIVNFINTLAFKLREYDIFLIQGNIPPFPNFSYKLMYLHDETFLLVLGTSPIPSGREANFSDESQTKPTPSLETAIQDCEQTLGWQECRGFLLPTMDHPGNFQEDWQKLEVIATEKAAEIAAEVRNRGVRVRLPTNAALLAAITDDELRQRCTDLLAAEGHYDRVINAACVILEDRVRTTIGAPNRIIGVQLMQDAFNADNPQLRLSDELPEQLGAMQMYRGIIAFFRNSTGHRIVDTYSREDAIQFVVWVDLLLKMIRVARRPGIAL